MNTANIVEQVIPLSPIQYAIMYGTVGTLICAIIGGTFLYLHCKKAASINSDTALLTAGVFLFGAAMFAGNVCLKVYDREEISTKQLQLSGILAGKWEAQIAYNCVILTGEPHIEKSTILGQSYEAREDKTFTLTIEQAKTLNALLKQSGAGVAKINKELTREDIGLTNYNMMLFFSLSVAGIFLLFESVNHRKQSPTVGQQPKSIKF